LSLRARNTLTYHDTGAVRIAHARGAVRAVYRITFSFDTLVSGRASNACAGVLCKGTINGTPAECKQNNRYEHTE